jgi:hypothetical protein
MGTKKKGWAKPTGVKAPITKRDKDSWKHGNYVGFCAGVHAKKKGSK